MYKKIFLPSRQHAELAHLGFQRFLPQPLLQPWIQSYWVAQEYNIPSGGYTETLYPDGGSSLIFNFTQGVAADLDFKANQIASKILFQHQVDCIGIRFNPGGAFKLFGMDMSDCKSAEQGVNFFATHVQALQAQLSDINTTFERIVLIENWLLEKAKRQELRLGHFDFFVTRVLLDKSDLESLLAQMPLGRRQLERKFQQEIGVSPAYLKQLGRVKKARQIITENPAVKLAEVAQDCGFYDQAHFIRHFQKITGQTPGQYKQRKMSQMYNYNKT